MKEIKLTQGKSVLVDDWNYEWLNQWKWCAQKDYNTFYAVRTIYGNGEKKVLSMHRLIMNTPDNMLCDHKDHNGLNCLEVNMRNATPSQNSKNTTSRLNGTSKYLGVSREKTRKNWRAGIRVNHKHTHLGYFPTEELAALAYNEAAIKFHGEFANLNLLT